MSAEIISLITRSDLRFNDEVERRFSFLNACGFNRERSEPTFVRYETDEVALNVYHGRHSFEIGLELEFKASSDAPFSFSNILRVCASAQAEKYRNYAARDVHGVSIGVSQLAILFAECLKKEVMRNWQTLHDKLKQERDAFAQRYSHETHLLQARRKADVAWTQKDYSSFVHALSSVRDNLDATEVAKLEFALKNCTATPNRT